jgi:membrane fusion protein YbhG
MNATQRARIAIPIVAVIIAAIVILLRVSGNNGVLTASGTVEATDADLGFQLAGRIDSIAVREGDMVQKGDTLAWLDRDELRARREAARAQVGAMRAHLIELERGFRSEEVEQARAVTRAAEERRRNAARDVERTQTLFDGGAVSREALDQAETALRLAEAEHDRAVEAQRLVESGVRPEQIAAQRASVAQAEANVAVIEATLANSILAAPFSGRITKRHREPGEIVSPGAPVVTLMNPGDRWVRIYVREDAVGRLSHGEPVVVTADAYPDKTYGGEITFIADEAEFTPSNVQTTEERVKLVYEVRVRITRDETFDLKPGLAADVRLAPATP